MPRTSKRKVTTQWGQGTIYERKDKKEGSAVRFRMQLLLAGKRVSISGRTHDEVLAKAEAKKKEVEGKIDVDLKAQPFSEFSHSWLEWYSKNRQGKQGTKGLSMSTRQGYERHLRHICEVIGDVQLQDLRSHHIDEILNKKDAPSHNITVRWYDLYKVIEKYANRKGALPQGLPSDRHWGRPAKEASVIKEAFTQEEAQLLLSFAHENFSQQSYVLIDLLLKTGLRINEALALTWDKFQLDTTYPQFEVSASLNQRSYPPTLGKTKNGRNRKIELSPKQVQLLKEYKRANDKRLMTSKVFPNAKGEFIDSHNWTNRVFKKLVAGIGLDTRKYSPHSTRHTYATLSIKSGLNMYLISQRLGHADVAFTMNRYGHLQEGMQQEVASALDYLDVEKVG